MTLIEFTSKDHPGHWESETAWPQLLRFVLSFMCLFERKKNPEHFLHFELGFLFQTSIRESSWSQKWNVPKLHLEPSMYVMESAMTPFYREQTMNFGSHMYLSSLQISFLPLFFWKHLSLYWKQRM